MPETRGWPRPLPRLGAKLSVTIGNPITDKIKPLVKAWRDIASKQRGAVGMGGEWGTDPKSPSPVSSQASPSPKSGDGSIGGFGQRVIRSEGDLADGSERDIRIKICEILQKAVQELGEEVEKDEGRFVKGLWTQSRKVCSNAA